jgi:hypothetical protein
MNGSQLSVAQFAQLRATVVDEWNKRFRLSRITKQIPQELAHVNALLSSSKRDYRRKGGGRW